VSFLTPKKPTPHKCLLLITLPLFFSLAACGSESSSPLQQGSELDVQASSEILSPSQVQAEPESFDVLSEDLEADALSGQLVDASEGASRLDDRSVHDVSEELEQGSDLNEEPVPEPGPSAWDDASALFGLELLHHIELSLSEAQLNSLAETPDTWIEVPLEVDGLPRDNVGLRLYGEFGDFRDLDHKASLLFDFERHDKGNELWGLKTLFLNNLSNEASLVKEYLAYALFRAAGIAAPRVGYATLSVNGQAYGLYLMVEPSQSDAFLRHWFDGESHGALYAGRNGQDLFVDSVGDFWAGPFVDTHKLSLYGLVQSIDWIQSDGDIPAQLDAIFGLQRMVDFMATELVIGHQDGYAWSRNAYDLYRATQSSPWAFLPLSAERTFAEHLAPLGGDGRVHKMCVEDPACRAHLGEAYEAVLTRIVEVDLAGIAQNIHSLVAEALLDDPRPALAPDAVSAKLQEVLNFISERPTTLADGLGCLDPDYGDEDEDGFTSCFGIDCNDADPDVFPGALEVCNFADDDCDGEIDETAEDEENCPTCETVYEDDNGSVILCRIIANYADAHEACLARGADLLSIHSAEEQAAIAPAAYADYSGHLWIGINDRIEEGTFAWTDGSPVNFEHWANNEPNDWGSGEDCGHLYDGGDHKWNDLPCGHEAGYLCRVPNLALP